MGLKRAKARGSEAHLTCNAQNQVTGHRRREWAQVIERPWRHRKGSLGRESTSSAEGDLGWNETRALADAAESEILGQTHLRGSSEPVLEDFFKVELVTDRQRVSRHRRCEFEQSSVGGSE